MIPVFIDTNIYEELGYNFDDRNPILQAFKKLVNEKEIKNIMISVIDGEIKSHLEKRKLENIRVIKKHCKWINELIDENEINEKLDKELNDFEKFKSDTKTEVVKIDNINSQKVLEKYFNVEPPFEGKKRNEFKDAFFIEAILQYIKKNIQTRYVVISKDEGVQRAIEKFGGVRIELLKSMQQLTDIVIDYGSKRKQELIEYLKTYEINPLIEKSYSVEYGDMEEENIEIDEISMFGVFGIDILKNLEYSIMVACDMGIVLKGKFSCLDYDKSYYSSEESEYLYKSYVNKNELMYICTVVIEIVKGESGYSDVIIRDFPEIEIDYENIKN